MIIIMGVLVVGTQVKLSAIKNNESSILRR